MLYPPEASRSTENKILASLNNTRNQHFLSQLEQVTLSQGQVVYEAGDKIDYVYFPETAVFSMLCTMEDGDTVEVGPVGDEGMVGLRIFLGAETSNDQVLVHVAGSAMRLSASLLKKELDASPDELPDKLMRYTQMLMAMTGRSGACYKLHKTEEQLARWLLMMSDYVGDELALTHELISLTLGVRRASISDAAGNLRSAGTICSNRGQIQVIDREGLRGMACECYQVIKDEYDRLYADLAKPLK